MPNKKPLPLKMRKPKKAKTITGADSWYYVEPKRIVVVGQCNHNQFTAQVALSRSQLEQALASMDEYREPVAPLRDNGSGSSGD